MIGQDQVPIDTETGVDDGDGDGVMVQVSICGAGGVHWGASGHMTEPSDELIADTILRAALAAASLHSTSCWITLQRLLTDYGGGGE